MVSALNGFGLAIGTMDIIGAVFFELMIICMLWRSRVTVKKNGSKQAKKMTFQGKEVGRRMLWIYVFLLNIWILASVLLICGIFLKKPQLLIFWLIWCLGGLILDIVFMLWWLWELLTGDAIDALTNILISILTMAIEFCFVYAVYNIYINLSSSGDGASNYIHPLLRFSYFLF
ncbi:uncharacterized protein LOC133842136 [Drosophila sulfurigaster albostrigata]|uniref:uncharacterized protein LOC133842136 n=1 Tax=Drosophila sulfurigaster albostrigata TaxID=89887 RepID=UPI002D21AAA6|nr:uncharacterized protein LOC133842136 [Drosophila sulfurigaster albostrigata]